jgi:hypothetical protein
MAGDQLARALPAYPEVMLSSVTGRDTRPTLNVRPGGISCNSGRIVFLEMTSPVVLSSTDPATDGGLIAVRDVTEAARNAGVDYRLLGGSAVLLHVYRTGVDVPTRGTADADCGVRPPILTAGGLVGEMELLGYTKTEGNRWERVIDGDRTATEDLLVPAYTSRHRASKQIGDVNTTEVPGLAEAFQSKPCVVEATFLLNTGERMEATVVLPDAKSMVLLKAGARRVRNEERDATDLWRCLEVASVDKVAPTDFDIWGGFPKTRAFLYRELGRGGAALSVITRERSAEEASRIATRIQALLQQVLGPED